MENKRTFRTCLIMMTTYNSEKYIRMQIESIINQSFTNWELIIQDDNSKDNTMLILKEFEEIESRIKVLSNNDKHGPYFNFHNLINKCKKIKKFDFYMFCDHDDIWEYNKINTFIESYDSISNKDKPIMLYADMKIINGNNEITANSMNEKLGMKYQSKWSVFYSHNVFGCNTFFNIDLFNIVPPIDTTYDYCKIMSHDNYYAKFASVFGQLIFIDKKLMLYRRYENNVTREQSYSYGLQKFISRIFNISSLAKAHARTYQQSIITIDIMIKAKKTKEEDKLLYIKKSLIDGGIRGLKTFICLRISCGKKIKTISRVIILLSGKYKKYL